MTDILMRTIRDGAAHVAPRPVNPGGPAPTNHPQKDQSGFAAAIDLQLDARDCMRGIIHVHETVTVDAWPAKRRLAILYPQWLPGYHSPAAPLELVAGLVCRCEGEVLPWVRDPVAVHALQIELPAGKSTVELEFQLLCPTTREQGRIGFTNLLLNLQWNAAVFYPAGFAARQIGVTPSVKLPPQWRAACAMQRREDHGDDRLGFCTVPLSELIDSPLFAGLHGKHYDIAQDVVLDVFSERPEQSEVGAEPVKALQQLVAEADLLFGARPFRKYSFLIAASDELGALGVEHHRCCEIVMPSDFFSKWKETYNLNDTLAHEFTHAWNGKFRRGRGACTASYDEPIDTTLLWVYEGLTQYWGQVLATRAGLWSCETYLQALALAAARARNVKGRTWRPVIDTTRDPIIASRKPLPWLSWQRSEDYYSDGQFVWLEADLLMREKTGNAVCLDDFAREFFGKAVNGSETVPYDHADVIDCLNRLVPHAWQSFFDARIMAVNSEPPLQGIARGGYELLFESAPTDFHRASQKSAGTIDLSFSIGAVLEEDGTVKEVIWESEAFHAGLTVGAQIVGVNETSFSKDSLDAALRDQALVLVGKKLKHLERYTIKHAGPKYPHLKRSADHALLDQILKPRS